MSCPSLLEAASRTGDVALVTAALEWLSERTRVTPTEWALGIEARARALLSEGDDAEGFYRESIERLGRTRVRVESARAHLVYGEWLRRENRRLDARAELRTAHELFAAMGAEAFADRARRELLATGETVRKRTVETRGELTAQEAQIARLARDGLSNPEIGIRLFISARTVQYHLRKVFIKLGISSRTQLDRVLPRDATTVPSSSRGAGRCAWPTTGHSHCALADASTPCTNDAPRMTAETAGCSSFGRDLVTNRPSRGLAVVRRVHHQVGRAHTNPQFQRRGMTTISQAHLPPLGEHVREEVGRELEATLIDLIDLALWGKQLHWTVVGPLFGALHERLDELVDSWRGLADTVAERAVAIGHWPDGQADAVVATEGRVRRRARAGRRSSRAAPARSAACGGQ